MNDVPVTLSTWASTSCRENSTTTGVLPITSPQQTLMEVPMPFSALCRPMNNPFPETALSSQFPNARKFQAEAPSAFQKAKVSPTGKDPFVVEDCWQVSFKPTSTVSSCISLLSTMNDVKPPPTYTISVQRGSLPIPNSLKSMLTSQSKAFDSAPK